MLWRQSIADRIYCLNTSWRYFEIAEESLTPSAALRYRCRCERDLAPFHFSHSYQSSLMDDAASPISQPSPRANASHSRDDIALPPVLPLKMPLLVRQWRKPTQGTRFYCYLKCISQYHVQSSKCKPLKIYAHKCRSYQSSHHERIEHITRKVILMVYWEQRNMLKSGLLIQDGHWLTVITSFLKANEDMDELIFDYAISTRYYCWDSIRLPATHRTVSCN